MVFDGIVPRFEETPLLALLVFVLLGYLSGSFPFAIWVTRLVKGVDVRDAGSRHATTTNTIRQAGFPAGVLVLVLDLAKGGLPVYLALQVGLSGLALGLVGAAAVAGHCWPLFAGFRGGMGLATAGGAYLAVNWLSFVIVLGVLVALALAIHHSARASVFAGLLAAPVLLLFQMPPDVIWVAFLTGLVIAGRFTIDWRREYNELWLDRG